MGWQDRNYNSPQINYGGNPFRNPLLNIIFGSIPIGTWFGIRVRVHASLLWFVAFNVFQAGTFGWANALALSVVTFVTVLLHEFGHCYGAHLVGGRSDNILLWPLGGIAFSETKRTPWARFVTVACGPLVNVALILIFGSIIFVTFGLAPPLNPLFPWVGSALQTFATKNPQFFTVYNHPVGKWLWWAFSVNWSILMFNLIPMFPLDGGKLLQIVLWKPLGYQKSMLVSCTVGMVLAVFLALFGLLSRTGILVFIAIFGFMDCLNQRRIIRWAEAEGQSDEPYDLSAAWDNPDRPAPRRKKFSKRSFRAARKKALRDQAEQAKIDVILAKVKEKGLHSLSWWEKRTLKKATERQRQQDLAERL